MKSIRGKLGVFGGMTQMCINEKLHSVSVLGCMRSQVQILSRRPSKPYRITREYAKRQLLTGKAVLLVVNEYKRFPQKVIRGKLGETLDLFVDACTQSSTAFFCAQFGTDSNLTTSLITKSIDIKGFDHGTRER